MTPHDLLANFEILAEAPNGISRLRELVLELAMRGKLVEQNPADEPAIELAKRIQQRLPIIRKRRNGTLGHSDSELASIQAESIPEGWYACTLGSVTRLINGRAYSRPELLSSGTPIIRIQNLNAGNSWFYSDLKLEDEKYCVDGDLLFAWSATFGPDIWHGPRAIFHYHIWKIDLLQGCDSQFMYYLLEAISERVRSKAHGVAMLHMTKEGMEAWPITIPPLSEQRRIVARVDELMARLGHLEVKRQGREAARTAARDSGLAALREALSPDDVEAAWLRIQERFGDLFATPGDVKPLRALTLELAVRGKLVEQDQNDEPASNLLMRAKARQTTHYGSGRQGRSSAETETAMPFDIPDGWSWARMDEFCDIKSGVAKGKNLQGLKCQDYPYLRVANVQAGYTDLAVMKMLPLPVNELGAYRLVKGDVLLTEGGDWDKLGRSAVWGGEIDPCIHQNHVFRARILDQGIHPRWISSFTNSPDGRAYFQSCAKQTTNLASINMTQLKICLVPIPPKAEQDRILARMDELMDLLDSLSESMSGQSKFAETFAAAAVHHLDV